jgi:CheY-specific phosphatase CheX
MKKKYRNSIKSSKIQMMRKVTVKRTEMKMKTTHRIHRQILKNLSRGFAGIASAVTGQTIETESSSTTRRIATTVEAQL